MCNVNEEGFYQDNRHINDISSIHFYRRHTPIHFEQNPKRINYKFLQRLHTVDIFGKFKSEDSSV